MLSFDALEMPEMSEDLLVRIFPYGTGIVDDHIRLLFTLREQKAHFFRHSGDIFRLKGIHLAAFVLDAEQRSPSGKTFLKDPAALFYIFKLKLCFRLILIQYSLPFCGKKACFCQALLRHCISYRI